MLCAVVQPVECLQSLWVQNVTAFAAHAYHRGVLTLWSPGYPVWAGCMSSHMCATGHDMWHVQLRLDMGMSSSKLDIEEVNWTYNWTSVTLLLLAPITANNALYTANDMY